MSESILFSLVLVTLLLIVFLSGRFRSENVALSGLAVMAFGQYFGLELLPSLGTIWAGFSSNAVVSLIAVMLIAAGLKSTGLMDSTSRFVLRVSNYRESWATAILMFLAGMSSAVIQNAAVVALFLPVAHVIARDLNISLARLALPVAIGATAGGTMTLVSTAPLIMVQSIIPVSDVEISFGATAKVGFLILISAIVIQLLVGQRLLPRKRNEERISRAELYRVTSHLHGIRILPKSRFVGRPFALLERSLGVTVAGYYESGRWIYTPYRKQLVGANMDLAIFAGNDEINRIVNIEGIKRQRLKDRAFSSGTADFVEMLVPAGSTLAGRRIRNIEIRKNYGLAPLAVYSGGELHHSNLRAYRLKGGDIIYGYSSWARLKQSYNPNDLWLLGSLAKEHNRAKLPHALFALVLAFSCIGLGFPSSLSFAMGAGWMVWSRLLVLSDVFRQLNWTTVALLGAMIPIGTMVSHSGAAQWLSSHLLIWFGDLSFWQLSLLVSVVAMLCGMAMTNVGAATVIIPIAVHLGHKLGVDTVALALGVALMVSNTYMLPSSQVNMLVQTPGGYSVKHYFQVGFAQSISYGVIVVVALNLGWL